MGKIEDVLEAIDPLNDVVYDLSIAYHAFQDTIDIFFRSFYNANGGLFFHLDENKTLCVYFILVPSPLRQFIWGREELMKKKEVVVFSGQNVFDFLGIDYSYRPKGFLEDLNALSHLIHDNSSKILKAFSDKHIENTYNALITIEGNNEKAISDAVRHYIFIPDW